MIYCTTISCIFFLVNLGDLVSWWQNFSEEMPQSHEDSKKTQSRLLLYISIYKLYFICYIELTLIKELNIFLYRTDA